LYDIYYWDLYDSINLIVYSILPIGLSLASILYIVNNQRNKLNYFFLLIISAISVIFGIYFYFNYLRLYFSLIHILSVLNSFVPFSVILILIFLERNSIKKLYLGISLFSLSGIIISELTQLILILLGEAFYLQVVELLNDNYTIIYNLLPLNILVVSELGLLIFFVLSLFDESIDKINPQELPNKNIQRSIRCPKCSTFIDSDAKYCYSCGCKVIKTTIKKRTVIKKIT
jgi:hypothetical protein